MTLATWGVTVVLLGFFFGSRLEFQYNRSRTHVLHLTRHRRLDLSEETHQPVHLISRVMVSSWSTDRMFEIVPAVVVSILSVRLPHIEILSQELRLSTVVPARYLRIRYKNLATRSDEGLMARSNYGMYHACMHIARRRGLSAKYLPRPPASRADAPPPKVALLRLLALTCPAFNSQTGVGLGPYKHEKIVDHSPLGQAGSSRHQGAWKTTNLALRR
jgi:hypothetical protein